MLDSIHKQGYYISSCSLIDFGGVFGVKIHQLSSATFLQPGAYISGSMMKWVFIFLVQFQISFVLHILKFYYNKATF